MAESDVSAIPEGPHSHASWVRLLFALYRTRRSGVLEVRFGKRWRRYLVVSGDPIAYSSDQAEDQLARTLGQSGIVPVARLQWFAERLGPDERLEDALLMAGVLTEAQLAQHRQERLVAGIADALRWATGTWSFDERPQLADRIDPALLPDPATLHALWIGVRQHVSMDEVLPTVTALGELRRADEFEEWFPHFEVEEPFDDLPSAIGPNCTVDVIYRLIPDRSGTLIKLLWLLDSAALFERQGRPVDAMAALLDAPPALREKKRPRIAERREAERREDERRAPDKPLPAPPKVEPRDAGQDQAEQIRIEHRKRMGADYYAFLGLDPSASAQAIDRRSKRLAGRYRVASKAASLPPEVRELAKELLTGAHLVWRTLADEERRAEYGRRLDAGQAPILQAIKGASRDFQSHPGMRVAAGGPLDDAASALQGGHIKARKFMEEGKFREAVALLRKERLENPSHPDVLADLGWATWKSRAVGEDDPGEAEEFLQLAWTFDAKNARAASFLAKVALETHQEELAAKWLSRVIKLDPTATWAKRALAGGSTSPGGAPQRKSGQVPKKSSPGHRFWRKGEG